MLTSSETRLIACAVAVGVAVGIAVAAANSWQEDSLPTGDSGPQQFQSARPLAPPMPVAAASLPTGTEEASRAPARKDGSGGLIGLDELDGVTLATEFEQLVHRARSGDTGMALALSGRLAVCNQAAAGLLPDAALERAPSGSHFMIEASVELVRRYCTGLTAAQLASGPQLEDYAAAGGHVEARLARADRTLLALRMPSSAPSSGGEGAPSATLLVADMHKLLANGEARAADLLAQVHAEGVGVPQDLRKMLVYHLASVRLRARDGQVPDDFPDLLAWSPDDRKQILEESERVLRSIPDSDRSGAEGLSKQP